MVRRYSTDLELAEAACTWFFIFEMILKLCALGCSGYWTDGWHALDGSIVSNGIYSRAPTLTRVAASIILRTLSSPLPCAHCLCVPLSHAPGGCLPS